MTSTPAHNAPAPSADRPTLHRLRRCYGLSTPLAQRFQPYATLLTTDLSARAPYAVHLGRYRKGPDYFELLPLHNGRRLSAREQQRERNVLPLVWALQCRRRRLQCYLELWPLRDCPPTAAPIPAFGSNNPTLY